MSITAPIERLAEGRTRPLVAYIKPSDYCNVGCDHCYLPEMVRLNKFRMSDDTLNAALTTVADLAGRQRAPYTLLIWHGGEPLALPIPYLERAAALAAEKVPALEQSIQTSLVPYRSAWAPLIHARFNSHVGSSMDFSQRTIKGDAGRYRELWLSKVAAARADGITVVPGTVPCMRDIERGAEIASWMLDHGFHAWNIDRYNSFHGVDPDRPSNLHHSRFLTDVFVAVMDQFRRGQAVRVNTVTAALRGVLFDLPGDRWGGSCSNDFIVVNPDGSTNACPDKVSFEQFSNVRDGAEAFAGSSTRRDWVRLHLLGHGNKNCPTCPFRTFCKSACPLTPNDPETEGECSGYVRHLLFVSDFIRANGTLVHDYLEEVLK